MKKGTWLGIAAATSVVGAIATVAGGHSQALGLSTQCARASISVGYLGVVASEGQFEARTYGGSGRFSGGAFLAETRRQALEIDRFTEQADTSWLAGVVGRAPKNMDYWISAKTAAHSFLNQLEAASLTGDYSNARNFGSEIISSSQSSMDISCNF